MKRIIRSIDKLNGWIGMIVCLLMAPLVLITTFEVFMRYIAKRPTIWAWDLNIQVFAILIMLGGGYTLLEKKHVMVDVFVLRMAPRTRAILDITTSVFLFLGVIVLMIGGWEIAWASFKAKEAMPTIWAPPYYYMKMTIPIGAFLVFLQGISDLLKNLMVVFWRQERN